MSEARTHLIWSLKWSRWHKRSEEDGGARGYTDDILRAGIFETSTALTYHDGIDNRATPLADVQASMRARVDEARAELTKAEERLRLFEAAMPSGATP